MKNLIFTTFLLVIFALTSYSQEITQTNKLKPKATYQVGSAKVIVWVNNGEKGTPLAQMCYPCWYKQYNI